MKYLIGSLATLYSLVALVTLGSEVLGIGLYSARKKLLAYAKAGLLSAIWPISIPWGIYQEKRKVARKRAAAGYLLVEAPHG